MKKALLLVIAVCAVVAGGGYFFSVQQFAKEAENFKESIMASDVFKTKSVAINKYKLQVILEGMTVEASKYLKQLNPADTQDIPNLQLETSAMIKFQYTPFLKKIKMSFPEPKQEGVIRVAGTETKLELTDTSRYLEFYLPHTPSFKDKTLGDFLKQDVNKIAATAKNYVLKVNGSEVPLVSVDDLHLLFTRDKVEGGDEITFDYDVKGGNFRSDEMYKIVEPFMPLIPGGPNFQAMYMPAPGFADATRDMKGQFAFIGDIHKIIYESMMNKNNPDFLKILEGINFESNSQDKLLNSEVNTEVKFKFGKAEHETSEIKYLSTGFVSSELQAVLPKIIHQSITSMLPDVKLTEADIQDLLPNFVAWGKSIVDFYLKGNANNKVGDGHLNISMAGYDINVAAKSTVDNITVTLKIKNYEDLFNSLQAYALKLANHPSMQIFLTAEQKVAFPTYVEVAKASLKSLGKEEIVDGKAMIIIEQTIPTALIGAMTANAVEHSGGEAHP